MLTYLELRHRAALARVGTAVRDAGGVALGGTLTRTPSQPLLAPLLPLALPQTTPQTSTRLKHIERESYDAFTATQDTAEASKPTYKPSKGPSLTRDLYNTRGHFGQRTEHVPKRV